MITFLHPVFTIVTIVLIFFSFMEVNNYKNYKAVWVIVFVMILLVGFREWVGADYPQYFRMYQYFGKKTEYSTIFNKAIFGKKTLEIEWLYVLIGKLFYQAQFPFFLFTFFIACLSILPKYFTFENSVVYPSLSLLLYMFPSYFSADGGHMRQAVAMSILIFSFYFIKKRKLLPFLLMIYLAMGFHKSAFVFIFAYWVAIIPINRTHMIVLLIICIILSPFQIYNYISLLDSIAPAEVYEGFSNYEMIEGNTNKISFSDLICLMYSYFLISYNKEACEKIPYYEYMRNIGFIGICLYFIFRGSPIFSSRLAMIFMIFMVMVIPNIIASIRSIKLRGFLHIFLIGYIIFYYFVYAVMQSKVGYTFERYHNFLW
ncbi:EpsG family protein [Riemerella columbina]|uniref:EpsG family protein n=1 Tax=Riemerella columbina TaxID=103810 RepID=UPI00039C34D7|nr:EpsG family protein [Riemerella columbina]